MLMVFTKEKNDLENGIYDGSVTNVVIPESVSIIGTGCFAGTNIETITIPETVTEIKRMAFQESKLKTIFIPSSVTSISAQCFGWCEDLETVEMSEGLETIEAWCFYSCKKLKELRFPNTLTGSLGDATCTACSSLESVYIPTNVTKIASNVFSGCSNLTTITINKPEDSISGAPWGATNATVVWNG